MLSLKQQLLRLSTAAMALMLLATASAMADGAVPEPAAEAGAQEAQAPQTPGAVHFIQIPAGDAKTIGAFYSSVFGWEVREDNGFTFFDAPDGMQGMFTAEQQPAAPRTGPVFFIDCAGVTAKLAEVEAAGGHTYLPTLHLPEDWGYIGVFGDPAGNAVGLWSRAE